MEIFWDLVTANYNKRRCYYQNTKQIGKNSQLGLILLHWKSFETFIWVWQLEGQFDVVAVKSQIIKLAEMIALAHITKYLNIFVRNLRIFEYIRTPTFQWSEYSNIFVFQFFYIRIRISNIRQKIFEYSNIFEYSLHTVKMVYLIFNLMLF